MTFPQIPRTAPPPLAVQLVPLVSRGTGKRWPKFDAARPIQPFCVPGTENLPKGTLLSFDYADTNNTGLATFEVPIGHYTIPSEWAAAPNLPGEDEGTWTPFVVKETKAHFVINGIAYGHVAEEFLCTQAQADQMLGELKAICPGVEYAVFHSPMVSIDYAGDDRLYFQFTLPGLGTPTDDGLLLIQGGLLWKIRVGGGVDANGNSKPGKWTATPKAGANTLQFVPDVPSDLPGGAWVLPQPIRTLAPDEYLVEGGMVGVIELRKRSAPVTGGGLTDAQWATIQGIAEDMAVTRIDVAAIKTALSKFVA